MIATGGYHRPLDPGVRAHLPKHVTQVHSADYRNPESLPEGAVLVVGSGQSGAQIAEDLHLAGRQVHLALGRAPRSARFYRGRDCIAWLEDMGVYDVTVQQHASGLAKRESTNHYMTGRNGGHDIDLRAFALQGMRLYGRLTGVEDGVLAFAPTLGEYLDHADSVMESIKNDIDRYIDRAGIEAPDRGAVHAGLGARGASPRRSTSPRRASRPSSGRPASDPTTAGSRSASSTAAATRRTARARPTCPGLYFLGLPWLTTWGSGRFAGVARDAAHVVERIAEHAAAHRTPVPA